MTFPAFIPEAVLVVVVVEVDMKPVFVLRIPFLFDDILEIAEAAADMIEDAVENDLDSGIMQAVAYSGKIIIGSQTAVDAAEIAGIIAVPVAFEDRIEQDSGDAKLLQMRNPVDDLQDPAFKNTVVVFRRAAETERLDLIKNLVIVHRNSPFLS